MILVLILVLLVASFGIGFAVQKLDEMGIKAGYIAILVFSMLMVVLVLFKFAVIFGVEIN